MSIRLSIQCNRIRTIRLWLVFVDFHGDEQVFAFDSHGKAFYREGLDPFQKFSKLPYSGIFAGTVLRHRGWQDGRPLHRPRIDVKRRTMQCTNNQAVGIFAAMQRRARVTATVLNRINPVPMPDDKHIYIFNTIAARLVMVEFFYIAYTDKFFHFRHEVSYPIP